MSPINITNDIARSQEPLANVPQLRPAAQVHTIEPEQTLVSQAIPGVTRQNVPTDLFVSAGQAQTSEQPPAVEPERTGHTLVLPNTRAPAKIKSGNAAVMRLIRRPSEFERYLVEKNQATASDSETVQKALDRVRSNAAAQQLLMRLDQDAQLPGAAKVYVVLTPPPPSGVGTLALESAADASNGNGTDVVVALNRSTFETDAIAAMDIERFAALLFEAHLAMTGTYPRNAANVQALSDEFRNAYRVTAGLDPVGGYARSSPTLVRLLSLESSALDLERLLNEGALAIAPEARAHVKDLLAALNPFALGRKALVEAFHAKNPIHVGVTHHNERGWLYFDQAAEGHMSDGTGMPVALELPQSLKATPDTMAKLVALFYAAAAMANGEFQASDKGLEQIEQNALDTMAGMPDSAPAVS